MTSPQDRQREAGETLIEILVSVVVIGITVSALIGGLTLALTASEGHRRLSNVEVVARAYGERIVDAATHQQSTTLTSAVSAGATVLPVAATTGFAANATAAVDGEVVLIKSIGGGNLTLDAALTENHVSGSTVTLYQSCPTAAQLAVSGFTVPAGSRLNSPTITNVEFFDRQGNAVSADSCNGTSGPGAIDPYWKSTGMPCKAFETPEHLVQCDPAVIRVTISLTSTDSTTRTGATTTTSILMRRGNE